MNISSTPPGSQPGGSGPDPKTGASDFEDGMTSADFTGGPIPDYQQQKFQEQMQYYQSGIQMVPNMSIKQWLFVKLLLCLPIVNLVMLIIWATESCGKGKETLVNFSRASLIWIGICILLWILFYILITVIAVMIYY